MVFAMTTSSLRLVVLLGCAAAVPGCATATNARTLDAEPPDADVLEEGGSLDGGPPVDGEADASDAGVARVFATATGYLAKSLGGGATGFAGGDGFCASAAEAGGLGGTWVAWLSTSRTNAIDRVTGAGPWYLVDRKTLVFLNKAALATVPRVGIAMNELAVEGPTSRQVWTGTSNGGIASPLTCDDWSNGTNTGRGMTGNAGGKNDWTTLFEEPCDRERSLYCFEVK
jgi:hypothetical protein